MKEESKKVNEVADAVAKCQKRFEADFDRMFKGKRVMKTAFHFFNWAAKGDKAVRERGLEGFAGYCRRTKVRRSWQNAAEWYTTGMVGGAVR